MLRSVRARIARVVNVPPEGDSARQSTSLRCRLTARGRRIFRIHGRRRRSPGPGGIEVGRLGLNQEEYGWGAVGDYRAIDGAVISFRP